MDYQKLADELIRFRASQQECHESVVRCFETFNMIANMEKKTKKMTKAEAFEWLKETKVRCYEERSNALYANLVAKITACGCEYDGFLSPPTASVWAVVIDNEGKIYHLPTKNANNYDTIDFKEIHADDILSIEIIEDTKPDCERNEHVKALQELIAKSGCIDCIIISKNDIGVLKK